MIKEFTCPRCHTKFRVTLPASVSCFWCQSGIQLPIPAPSELARQFPKGFTPPRPALPEKDES